jgi:hypothetical protein
VTVRRIVPDLYTVDKEASRRFFVDGIGLEVAMDLPFITTFASRASPRQAKKSRDRVWRGPILLWIGQSVIRIRSQARWRG